MRKPFLVLAAVALVGGACSSGSSASPGSASRDAAPDQYHRPWSSPAGSAAPSYDGVTFEDPGVNPYVDPVEDRESTFGLDVDTAAYNVGRRFVDDGFLPDPDSVRVEEYVNAFDGGYEPPEDGTFAIHVDGGPSPFLPEDELLMRVGLKAVETRERARPDAALTFVVDTSGSMAREDRLGLVKESLAILVRNLRRSDTVAIVEFGSDARVVIGPTPVGHDEEILHAIARLEPGSSTNAEAGLRLGYELARETLLEEGINRVVLASDGVANVGLTNAESILETIREDAEAGIQLVSVGVGMGNFNDALLEQLADHGDGFYAYVNTLDEAERLFEDDLLSTLQTVALDARVQVEFELDAVAEYRLVGYENRAIDDDDFRDRDVEAGAIGAGHSVTALYALRLTRDTGSDDLVASVRLRWVDPTTRRQVQQVREARLTEIASSFEATNPHFKLAAVVSATAEVLRESRWAKGVDLDEVADVASEIEHELPEDDQVAEFLDMLDDLADLDR